MIDQDFNVKRYIAVYSKKTEELVKTIDISSFDIEVMRARYRMENSNDPMYDCYQILEQDINTIADLGVDVSALDYEKYEYFLEASAI